MTYTVLDDFAGFGGSSQGITAVPGTELSMAANHLPLAVEVHSANFPDAEHYCGDIAKADIKSWPRVDLFWASPSCPPWSDARGKKRDFDRSTQGVLFDPEVGAVATDPATVRARALMEEIPRYIKAMWLKGKPVLGGVVENVVQVTKWDQIGRWRKEIESHGYRTRWIALNAMHVTGPVLGKVAQSRNRGFLAYWLEEFGRAPDWDKWLRPKAYCPDCDEWVSALQVFKKPKAYMGVYGIRNGQYVYRCPRSTCRHRIIEPPVIGAETIIDWSLDPGPKIGERADHGKDPLEPATIARIEAGLERHARPMLAPAGGTWREHATPLDVPMPTRTTRETDGLVVPPLLVPVAKRAGVNMASTVEEPMRTQTTRREVAMVMPPFISLMRGGGSKQTAYPVTGPIPTVSAQGNHHGLVGPPADPSMLLAYYSNRGLSPVSEPVGTLTTRDRYAVVGGDTPPVDQCTFRMLSAKEVGRGMGFRPDYRVKDGISKRDEVRGYGNAVPPAMSEVIVSALVETFSGEHLEPAA
ncbi:DNA cytosine methyltransferase [Amycolatopsis sp. NPDC058340]|uniref:DNA cytosine methyltransferase n=1 Tax=Amycolatopsis sp. NPDC058340 TaxID=3346453 RepID=UPI0036566D6F